MVHIRRNLENLIGQDKYIIFQESDSLLFLVDRNKTTSFWWTYSLEHTKLFDTAEDAEKVCNALKYGKCKVIPFDEGYVLRKNRSNKHITSLKSKANGK